MLLEKWTTLRTEYIHRLAQELRIAKPAHHRAV